MTKTFNELISDVRVNADNTKQTQLLPSDLLVQMLKVLIEIRDELEALRSENGDVDGRFE